MYLPVSASPSSPLPARHFPTIRQILLATLITPVLLASSLLLASEPVKDTSPTDNATTSKATDSVESNPTYDAKEFQPTGKVKAEEVKAEGDRPEEVKPGKTDSDAATATSNVSAEVNSTQPPVDFTFNSFSSAFIKVLQNIQETSDKQRLTLAGQAPSGSFNLQEFAIPGPTENKNGAPPKTETKPALDLATEVTPRVSEVELPADGGPKQDVPLAEKIAPSVAGTNTQDRSTDATALQTQQSQQAVEAIDQPPLEDELNEYFETLKSSSENGETLSSAEPGDPELAESGDLRIGENSEAETGPLDSETPNRVPPLEPDVRITRQMAALQPRIADALRFYFEHPLNTGQDSAWSVMHSMLGYGPRGLVAIGSSRGKRTNVVHWMCQNGLCANRRLLYLDRGYIRGHEGPGYEGHPGQFLAMLAQIGIERDFPMTIQGQQLSVDALVSSEMYTCSSAKELTFKLISLSYYLSSETRWKSENGEIWDVPKMLTIELSQPINGAACGGTHRIMAISSAVRNRWIRGEPKEGIYAQAEDYVRKYQKYALSLQNRDGSFSSEWFKRAASSGERDRQLQTTGHILEWLVYTLPRDQLSDPRVVSAVEFLTDLMTRHRYHDWEVGPRGHAIRALSLYHQRVFERRPATPEVANTEIWSAILR